MNIAIIGTRGIPNNYGGFEQFAEFLSKGLVKKNHSVTVYNSHNHPYRNSTWNSITIEHKYDPEYLVGTFGQFIYDLNCILHTRRKQFDIILQLGYTSSSVWSFLFPKQSKIVTNMDGLEWKRAKYSSPVKQFLRHAEKLAVNHSNFLVSDSLGIQSYLKEKYSADSCFIPYAASLFNTPNISTIQPLNVKPFEYNMLIARIEPENNIETILDGCMLAKEKKIFLVIGNYQTKYGSFLKKKYKEYSFIRFTGSLYDQNILNNLRYFSNLYFHGHSVGGTNPSLLEAMASDAVICAHDNPFNASVLGSDSFYFDSANAVKNIIDSVKKDESQKGKIENNRKKIDEIYSLDKIIESYESLFFSVLNISK